MICLAQPTSVPTELKHRNVEVASPTQDPSTQRDYMLDVMDLIPQEILGAVWSAACQQADRSRCSLGGPLLREHAIRILGQSIQRLDKRFESETASRWTLAMHLLVMLAMD